MTDEQQQRDPEQAIDDVRAKRDEGEEPSPEEREFLESEGVRLDPEEGTGRPVD